MSDTPPTAPVLVIWEDICTRNDEGGAWVETKKDLDYKPHLVHSVGWIVKDLPEGIHLTFAWHPESMAPPDQIPRSVIRSITPLGPLPVKRTRRRP